MSKRIARFNEQLKRELSELIRTRVRDPRVGPVTITGVDVAADLGSAKVYVRAIGGHEGLERALEGLAAAAPFLRTTLGRSLHVRKVPELRFREDRSYEGARRIEEVLSEVEPREGWVEEGAGAREGESGERETGEGDTHESSDGGSGEATP